MNECVKVLVSALAVAGVTVILWGGHPPAGVPRTLGVSLIAMGIGYACSKIAQRRERGG